MPTHTHHSKSFSITPRPWAPRISTASWRITATTPSSRRRRGCCEVRRVSGGFTKLLSDIPQAKWNLKTQLYENDVYLLEWTADSAKTKIDDGIDTFVFKDGFIRAQIVRYTLQRK
jgi:hypothetical protein